MPSDVTREDFKHVVTRLNVVEREVEGEKAVTRHILEQTRHNSGDLAALRVEMKEVRIDVKGIRGEIKEMRGEMTDMRGEITGMRGEMTGMHRELTDVRGELTDLKGRVGRVEAKVDGLTKNLPKIVGDAVRGAMRGKR